MVHQRGTYSLIAHDLWQDEAVRELGTAAKALFVWSFTHNAQASLTGLSVVTPEAMCAALGFDAGDLHEALLDLRAKPLALYDRDFGVLWCINRAAYSMRSEPTVKAALKIIRNMPPSPLLDAWRGKYAEAVGDAA